MKFHGVLIFYYETIVNFNHPTQTYNTKIKKKKCLKVFQKNDDDKLGTKVNVGGMAKV